MINKVISWINTHRDNAIAICERLKIKTPKLNCYFANHFTGKVIGTEKIEKNIERDREVTKQLESEGYVVLRFWGKQIKKELDFVVGKVESEILKRRKEIN